MTLSPPEQAKELVRAAENVKAEQIIVFDVRENSSLTDYVLICQGRSQAHAKGIADHIREALNQAGIRPLSVEGQAEGSWILMDYTDVIVHIFHPETRAYYNLEGLHKNDPVENF